MEIRAVNAYHGQCPLCERAQTSLDEKMVDILCSSCAHLADSIFNTFEIPAVQLRRDHSDIEGFTLLTNVKTITCMEYATEREFEMILPSGIKKIRMC